MFWLFSILFIASGCAGKQGVVNVDQTVKPSTKIGYGIHKAGSVLFGTLGQVDFSGRPNSLSYYAYSVNVDLKNIQESVAHKVLSSIYDDVAFSGDHAEIYSKITDFSYSWELTHLRHGNFHIPYFPTGLPCSELGVGTTFVNG